jgi:hypothetical protein
MGAHDKPYQRLPGTGYRQSIPSWAMVGLFFVIGIFVLLFRGRRIQLWRGADHLLLVETDGYREFYKRFHYQDIQALVVRKTNDGLIMNVALLILAGFFGIFAVAASDPGLRIFLLVLAGIFGLFALANTLSGPTTRCSIRTAVQTEELPSLSRLRLARKVFGRLQPLIVVAQGEMNNATDVTGEKVAEPGTPPSGA